MNQLSQLKKYDYSPGLVVKGGGLQTEGCEFKSRRRKICKICFKKTENKRKRGEDDPF